MSILEPNDHCQQQYNIAGFGGINKFPIPYNSSVENEHKYTYEKLRFILIDLLTFKIETQICVSNKVQVIKDTTL